MGKLIFTEFNLVNFLMPTVCHLVYLVRRIVSAWYLGATTSLLIKDSGVSSLLKPAGMSSSFPCLRMRALIIE